jgi:hypothetical protein
MGGCVHLLMDGKCSVSSLLGRPGTCNVMCASHLTQFDINQRKIMTEKYISEARRNTSSFLYLKE